MKYSLLQSILASTFISASLFAAPALQANEADFPHLETVGVSQLIVAADMAEINVEVTIKDKTAKGAKALSDKAVAKFIERLKAAGIAQTDIQSANLNLQPQYHYQKDKPAELTGYNASRQITVTVKELSRLNNILDSALEEGINRINNIALKTSKESEYIAKARQAAIIDAQSKAKSLAQGFGVKIDSVWDIRYFAQHPVQPVMLRMNAASSSFDAAETYQQGQVTFTDRIEVVFKLKN
ncbi:oxidative stress defense protein [Shewanella sp. D64]|uniref:oxidative stress defense protein n=1 Tax=unclassified Shewanella TaxID=196818 RepID=UPI0022BA2BD5|nr:MULTISPECIES: oxidative stress defense protein [unclassified Shewanella]MEC4724454.1 oxidative stress defense protein [Shewanella sp. D64]MEC4736769.1 oxidative stress defense protein [Shewanella sp. E94]WBJ94566.1 oxidative stress defense protein [Shewanella sp. MTB7]